MFAAQYQAKYQSKYRRRRLPGTRRCLAIFLVCCLLLFSTLDPAPTFSRYMVNLREMFNLHTSQFYLTPSLTLNQLSYGWEDGFTQDTVLTVANNSGSQVTTHNMQYSITLMEAGPNPLFDLYMDDDEGGKTLCENNLINGTLAGGSTHSNSYTLYLGLKDESVLPQQEFTELNLVVASSEPYIRSYTFKLKIQVGEPALIQIPGTEIYRPNVEIPDGQIMVFKDDKYEFLTMEDLLSPLVVDAKVDQLGRLDLVGGSLYVPASAGHLLVDDWEDKIDWDVAGHVILEPDILVDSYKPVDIVSHYGDIILNNTTIAGETKPYQVNITAEEGSIEANGATLLSRSDASGVISLVAQLDINMETAEISSAGDGGVNVISMAGNIDASNANIVSTNGAETAAVLVQTPGNINLDGATVESKGSALPPDPALLIHSTGDSISAKNASLTCTNGGTYMEIIAQDFIDLEQSSIVSHGTYGLKILCIDGGINAPNTNILSTLNSATATLIIQATGQINLDGSIVESEASAVPPTPALLIESRDFGISAKSSIISSAGAGKLLKIAAQGLIELDQTPVSSGGPLNISTQGAISAVGADLTASSNAGLLEVLAQGFIALDQAILSSGGNINVQSPGDISAKSANIFNNGAASYGHSIMLKSTNGVIDLSSLEVVGIPQTLVNSPTGNILIKAGQDIHCEKSKLTASSSWGMELRFQSTGLNSKLWVQEAILAGYGIFAEGLQIEGIPTNGMIQ